MNHCYEGVSAHLDQAALFGVLAVVNPIQIHPAMGPRRIADGHPVFFADGHRPMLTPVTLWGMDDKPAIEYSLMGYVTLNFDDGPVKLRRCRVGDLQYGKDLLAELRTEIEEPHKAVVDEINELRESFRLLAVEVHGREQTDEETAEVRSKTVRVEQLRRHLDDLSMDFVYRWLSAVALRMGDGPTPPKDEWPLDILLVANTPGDVVEHWQTRPLASGKSLGQNGTTSAANSSTPPHPAASSPPAQQPQ